MIHLTKQQWYILALVLILLFAFISLVLLLYRTTAVPPVPKNPLFRDTTAATSDRIADLLSYMTLEEKVGQMALVEKNSLREKTDISTYGLGGLLSGFGGKPEDNSPVGWKNMVEGFITESKSTRLGIPVLYGIDAVHGHTNVPGATVFPHLIGLGASRDTTLVTRVAAATAAEIRTTGIRASYSPTYDMPEDIRWGRGYETFGDDPILVGTLGAAYIKGLHTNFGTSTPSINILATPKHYIGLGGMQWNTSSNENFKIDQGTTLIDDTRLRTHYLPPFKEAVDAGALSVMVGLNSWGDTKLAASSYLMQTVLKDELGFTGFIVSDWYGVYEIPGTDYEAAVTAINAGVDLVMLPFDYKEFVYNVTRAVRRGDIKEARINDAVTRILRAKFALGLFDETGVAPPDLTIIGAPEHRALAREAVSKSLVLLKNTGQVLPLSKTTQTIRVAGSAADNTGRQSGAWTIEWQGVDGNNVPGATSILTGIRAAAGPNTTVEFDLNANFLTSSPKADIGIAVVGEVPYAEGWGDNAEPALSEEDLETIAKLRQTSEKVVVVLITGRPLIITDELPNWDAVVVAWLPGSEGAGVADNLFGTTPFTATLPLPWPTSISQLPIKDEKTSDGTPVLFPRGFGLR